MQGTGAWRGLRARWSFPASRPLPAVQRHRGRCTREAAPRVSIGGRAEDRSHGSREDRWGGDHCHTGGLTPPPGPHLGLRAARLMHVRGVSRSPPAQARVCRVCAAVPGLTPGGPCTASAARIHVKGWGCHAGRCTARRTRRP